MQDSFSLNEELFASNNVATIFHRTPSLSNIPTILRNGWSPGGGRMYGVGIYTTYVLKDQLRSSMDGYGNILLKFKYSALDQILCFSLNVAKHVHGKDFLLKDQLKKLAPDFVEKLSEDDIREIDLYNEQFKKGEQYSSDIAKSFVDRFEDKLNLFRGIEYYGRNDGRCMVIYPPAMDLTLMAVAVLDGLGNDDHAESKIKWQTVTSKKAFLTAFQKGLFQRPSVALPSPIKRQEDISLLELIKQLLSKNSKLTTRELDKLFSYNLSEDKMFKILLRLESKINVLFDSGLVIDVIDKFSSDIRYRVFKFFYPYFPQILQNETIYGLLPKNIDMIKFITENIPDNQLNLFKNLPSYDADRMNRAFSYLYNSIESATDANLAKMYIVEFLKKINVLDEYEKVLENLFFHSINDFNFYVEHIDAIPIDKDETLLKNCLSVIFYSVSSAEFENALFKFQNKLQAKNPEVLENLKQSNTPYGKWFRKIYLKRSPQELTVPLVKSILKIDVSVSKGNMIELMTELDTIPQPIFAEAVNDDYNNIARSFVMSLSNVNECQLMWNLFTKKQVSRMALEHILYTFVGIPRDITLTFSWFTNYFNNFVITEEEYSYLSGQFRLGHGGGGIRSANDNLYKYFLQLPLRDPKQFNPKFIEDIILTFSPSYGATVDYMMEYIDNIESKYPNTIKPIFTNEKFVESYEALKNLNNRAKYNILFYILTKYCGDQIPTLNPTVFWDLYAVSFDQWQGADSIRTQKMLPLLENTFNICMNSDDILKNITKVGVISLLKYTLFEKQDIAEFTKAYDKIMSFYLIKFTYSEINSLLEASLVHGDQTKIKFVIEKLIDDKNFDYKTLNQIGIFIKKLPSDEIKIIFELFRNKIDFSSNPNVFNVLLRQELTITDYNKTPVTGDPYTILTRYLQKNPNLVNEIVSSSWIELVLKEIDATKQSAIIEKLLEVTGNMPQFTSDSMNIIFDAANPTQKQQLLKKLNIHFNDVYAVMYLLPKFTDTTSINFIIDSIDLTEVKSAETVGEFYSKFISNNYQLSKISVAENKSIRDKIFKKVVSAIQQYDDDQLIQFIDRANVASIKGITPIIAALPYKSFGKSVIDKMMQGFLGYDSNDDWTIIDKKSPTNLLKVLLRYNTGAYTFDSFFTTLNDYLQSGYLQPSDISELPALTIKIRKNKISDREADALLTADPNDRQNIISLLLSRDVRGNSLSDGLVYTILNKAEKIPSEVYCSNLMLNLLNLTQDKIGDNMAYNLLKFSENRRIVSPTTKTISPQSMINASEYVAQRIFVFRRASITDSLALNLIKVLNNDNTRLKMANQILDNNNTYATLSPNGFRAIINLIPLEDIPSILPKIQNVLTPFFLKNILYNKAATPQDRQFVDNMLQQSPIQEKIDIYMNQIMKKCLFDALNNLK